MPPEKTATQELQDLFPRPDEKFSLQQPEPVNDLEPLPEDLKNRHVRRIEAKLQAEREANIAMAARLEALSEAQKLRQETGTQSAWAEKVQRIYGTDKPENAAATELLINAFKDLKGEAKQEALEEWKSEQRKREEETEKEVQTLENYIEQIEDQYGVDLSSTPTARERRSEYISLLEKLSPKQNGEVIDYADPFETYELFASRQGRNPAKDMASRGMTQSRPIRSTVQDDATVKFLKEQGLLEPF